MISSTYCFVKVIFMYRKGANLLNPQNQDIGRIWTYLEFDWISSLVDHPAITPRVSFVLKKIKFPSSSTKKHHMYIYICTHTHILDIYIYTYIFHKSMYIYIHTYFMYPCIYIYMHLYTYNTITKFTSSRRLLEISTSKWSTASSWMGGEGRRVVTWHPMCLWQTIL